MDITTFALGAVGALLTLYLAKRTVIPEFRTFYDTKDKVEEANSHREHTKEIEKDINDIQDKLKKVSSPKEIEPLKIVLNSSMEEIRNERDRIQKLEGEIQRGQILTRSLGFIIYVLLGGVFGSILAGYVKIEGLAGDLPKFIESIVIGASWTTYLSTIGLQSISKEYDDLANTLENEKKTAGDRETAYKQTIDGLSKQINSLKQQAQKPAGTARAANVANKQAAQVTVLTGLKSINTENILKDLNKKLEDQTKLARDSAFRTKTMSKRILSSF